MLIAKRHPTLKRAAASERGVMATYAAGVLAVAGSILALGLAFGGTHPVAEPVAPAPAPLLSPEEQPSLVDADAKRLAAEKAAQDHSRAVKAAEEQPVYDEAAGVAVSTR